MTWMANLMFRFVGFCSAAALYAAIVGTAVSLLGRRPSWPSMLAVFIVTLTIFLFRAVHKLLTDSHHR